MWRVAALLLLGSCTFLVGLGGTAIVDSDEAYYAEASRAMAADGDWITPQYSGAPRLNKPILYYWLAAGTTRLLGPTEAAVRLWAALSGLALALVAFALGRRWADPPTGLLAGAIVATSTGVVVLARQALPDLPLAVFISVTIWAGMEAIGRRPPRTTTPDARGWSRAAWLRLAAVAMALGMITKGPVAVALPLVAWALLFAWERWRGDPPAADGGPGVRDALVAAALFVAVAAPWYLAAARVHGARFLVDFFVGENIERFASDRFNERREPWFYLGVMAGGLLPWSVYGWLGMRPLRERLRGRRPWSAADVRLLCWAIGPLLLLTASVGSQPRYILPCLVPVAVLLARAIVRRLEERPGRDVLFAACTALAGVVLALFGALVYRAAPVLEAAEPGWRVTGAVVMLVAGVLVVVAALVAPARRATLAVTIASAATVVAFSLGVQRLPRPEPVEVVAAVINERGRVEPVHVCGAFWRNLTFYLQRPVTGCRDHPDALTEALARANGALVVAETADLAAAEARLGRRVDRLVEVAYLDTAVWQKPGTVLVDPDPGRHVRRIALVRAPAR